MRHYIDLWKRTFDYKGVSSRAEYRVPLLVTAALAALSLIFVHVYSTSYGEWPLTVFIVAGALFTLHIPPMMALTVRRLRDAGKRPVWAVLSCLAGVGTLIVMLICLLAASGYSPFRNIHNTVYGPPPELYDDYDPRDNLNEDIYGPPEMLESRYAEEAAEIASRRAAEAASEEGTADEN